MSSLWLIGLIFQESSFKFDLEGSRFFFFFPDRFKMYEIEEGASIFTYSWKLFATANFSLAVCLGAACKQKCSNWEKVPNCCDQRSSIVSAKLPVASKNYRATSAGQNCPKEFLKSKTKHSKKNTTKRPPTTWLSLLQWPPEVAFVSEEFPCRVLINTFCHNVNRQAWPHTNTFCICWKKGKDPHPQDKIQHLDFTKDPRPPYYKTPPCAFYHKNVRSKAVFGP